MDELLEYLNGEMSSDYWYDEALSICIEILDSFTNKERKQLISMISDANHIFCVRLAECLQEVAWDFAIECYAELLNCENTEVIIACIDSMRGRKDIKDSKSLITAAMGKIKEIYQGSSAIEKIVLDEFIKMYK